MQGRNLSATELKEKPKHVFLITIDCLRADALSCIGKGSSTPNIDRLAEDSNLFTRAFANGPGTNQSFPAIITSTYFLMHGGMHLLPQYTTLAEVLNSHGFKTVAFHSNPFLSKGLGWSRGFSEFYDFMDILKSPSAAVTRYDYSARIIKAIDRVTGILSNKRLQSILRTVYYGQSEFEIPYVEGRALNKRVIEWINHNKERKFFLWMHYMDPHRPYIPPSDYLSGFATREEAFIFDAAIDPKIGQGNVSGGELNKLRRLYEGEVRYVDDCMGSFLEFLEFSGLLDDSLLILMGDHGEAFAEHNKLTHAYDIVYNEVIHVPLLIYGLAGCSRISDEYVQLLDIPPTILDAIGIGKPKDFLGDSFMPALERNREPRCIFSESAKPDLINLRYDTSKKVISCIAGGWKLIVNELLETAELYNLKEDFQEKNNLVTIEKEIYSDLASLIQKHLLYVKFPKIRAVSRTPALKSVSDALT